jgi:hypothetical protein
MELINQNLPKCCLPQASPLEFCFSKGGRDPFTSLCGRNLRWAVHIDDALSSKRLKPAATNMQLSHCTQHTPHIQDSF